MSPHLTLPLGEHSYHLWHLTLFLFLDHRGLQCVVAFDQCRQKPNPRIFFDILSTIPGSPTQVLWLSSSLAPIPSFWSCFLNSALLLGKARGLLSFVEPF